MVGLEEVIAQQIAVYEANQRLLTREHRPGRGKLGPVAYGPYLLMSREKGSGGHTVAQLVGQCLGWPVFDSEIVDRIAERTQVRRQLIESLDEHARNIVEDLVAPIFNRKDIGQAGYIRHLKQVVLALGHQGDAIIIGRGAQFMLPPQFGLRVRLIAPFEVRAQRIAAAQHIPLEHAQQEIGQSDQKRAAFIHRNFKYDINDPLHQDIIINTSALECHQVAEIILGALQQKLDIEVEATGPHGMPVAASLSSDPGR